MTGVTITVDFSETDIRRAFEKLLRNQRASKSAMRNIGEILLDSTKERFTDEKGPDGKPWSKNAPATLMHKRNPKILQELGEGGGLLGTIAYQANDVRVEVGSPKDYAAIHQFGGEAGRNRAVKIPARPYLGLSTEDKEDIIDTLQDHLLEL